jgi:leucyl aminopeptidase
VDPVLIPASGHAPAIPLSLVTEAACGSWLDRQTPAVVAWCKAQHFTGERGRLLQLPASSGAVAGVVLGLGPLHSPELLSCWDAAGLPERVPGLILKLEDVLPAVAATQFAFGWLYGSYRYTLQSSARKRPCGAQLVEPVNADLAYARAAAEACAIARNLINTPANELGPDELAAAVEQLALDTGGSVRRVSGVALQSGYPLISAVGQGSARPPLLVDVHWRRAGAPRVCLVGKGVCFDTGGLDLKPSSGMLLMKKDMGGAACALALAQLLRALEAPVDLRLLIPAVENSVGGQAFRPGDVWRSRKGLTVEIGNTDAEGRLVLADALADADDSKPDLLIDFATLTGAARTALGPELPAIYATDTVLLQQWAAAGDATQDPLWPMPLWANYDDQLASRVADLNNVSSDAFAGSIIGALFLRRFVTQTANWLHADIYGWNPRERPGRPVGAEAQAVRATYALIRQRYG